MFIFGKWYWAVAFLLPTFMYFQILFNKHTVNSHNIHTLIAQSCPLTLQTSGLGGPSPSDLSRSQFQREMGML